MTDLNNSASGITLRSLLIGAVLCAAIGAGATYGSNVIGGSMLAANFTTGAAFFIFFFLVGGVNTFLRIIGRSHALKGGELATIYAMMMIAASMPTVGMMGYLPPVLTAPFYYATPENNWANTIQPLIPQWMVPDPAAAKALYEGLAQGASVPWEMWITPLLAWGVFILALFVAMICMTVILRKQWMEHERLIYPIVQVPLDIIKGEQTSGFINSFFKSKLMWAGFLIPFTIQSMNALHNYYSYLPSVTLSSGVPIFRATQMLPFYMSFPTVGFTYLINLDISLGLWVFGLIAILEKGLFHFLGVHSPELSSAYGLPAYPFLAHQGMGAMIVLVFFGLWVGRNHLLGVWRAALGKADGDDDSDEILSYRTAVFGILGSILVMSIWLWQSGLSTWWFIFLFLFGTFIAYLGLTRIVVQGGVAVARSPMIGTDFLILGVGSSSLGAGDMLSLAFTFIWAADISTFVMASSANGLKLVSETNPGKRKRLLFWGMIIAIVVTFFSTFWMLTSEAYKHGGINFVGQGRWSFIPGAKYPFEFASQAINTPVDPHPGGWVFKGIGATLMTLLMIARRRYLWWPLHPLGFPISVLGYPVLTVWISVFIAWLFKAIILKYGGPKLYRKGRPFFLGLIAGQFIVMGVWLIIDHFTGMKGNQLGLT
jgi:hypothetical protein